MSSRGVTAFFGTPEAAIPSLAALRANSEVRLVVTRPDKPRGRSGRPQPPPIKQAALEWELSVSQPDKAAEVAEQLVGIDLAVVVAYGQILPESLLAVPRLGFVNVHFSLLPRWRGAAPVARAILAGDRTTGVTLMQLDAGMDTGDVIAARSLAIDPSETTGSLTERLAMEGADLLTEHLAAILEGTAHHTPQGEDATQANKVTGDDARIDFHSQDRDQILRMVRAFNPKPGAWSLVDQERLKLWEAEMSETDELAPGEIALVADRLMVGCEGGDLVLLSVQPAGGGRMSGSAWANGHRGTWRFD